MPLFLKSEPKQTLAGLTFFTDSLLGNWVSPMGIYVPPSVDIDRGTVNVLIWLHGWFVPSIEHLFYNDQSAVRQQVLASGRGLIVIAPYLGNGHRGAGSTYSVGGLKRHWGESCLNQVLGTLALARDPKTYAAPWQRSNLTPGGLAQSVDLRPGLRLGKLIIACHSGGGQGMRYLVDALGRYKSHLAECWGFDCLYGANARPDDDARFWYKWVMGGSGRKLYVSYGESTVPQSVKLYLMGQGMVDLDGARLEPEGDEVERLQVKLGIDTPKHVDDLMGLDELLQATTPKAGRLPALASEFAARAAANLHRSAGWPANLMAMHYAIARDGLLERLRGVSL